MQFAIHPFHILSSICCFFLVFSIHAQVEKGDRVFAWQVDMAEDNDYFAAYNFGLDACMESTHITFVWSEIEATQGEFVPAGIERLDLINYFHPLFDVKAELNIGTINTVTAELPTDLVGGDFDSPLVVERFKALLDTVFNHLPDLELSVLNIGNEVDVFFGTNETSYLAYKSFLDEVIPYAQSLYFDLHGTYLKVGTVCTFDGLVSSQKAAYCQTLNDQLDVVAVTYYPLNTDFTMESPEVVQSDFNQLVSLYPDTDQPIYFTECGYSSSTICASSEELQRAFFENVFTAWDEHYNNIKYLSVFKTTDWSQEQVDTYLEYYGIDVIEFAEYLRAIGVRTWEGSGTNKLAYEQIKCELAARNWCDVTCSVSVKEEATGAEWTVIPNPVETTLFIPTNFDRYRILTSTGKLVYEGLVQHQNIDVSDLEVGLYVLQVFNAKESTINRFIKL